LLRLTVAIDNDDKVTLAIVEGYPAFDTVNTPAANTIAVIHIHDLRPLDPFGRDSDLGDFVLDFLLASAIGEVGGSQRDYGNSGKTETNQQED